MADSSSQKIELQEDNVLIVQLSYDQLLLEESLFVYQTPEYTFIPVQGLIDALDFPLELNIDTLSLDGWFISENNRFSLDIANSNLFIEGIQQSWPKNLRYASDGFDLYIDLGTVEKWFDITLVLDVSQLELRLSSSSPLPIISQKLRAEKRAKLSPQTLPTEVSDYLHNHYDWLGSPSFDIEYSHQAERFQENKASGQRDYQVSHFNSTTLQGSMDLLKHSLKTSYVYQGDEQDLRLTFSRAAKGPNENLGLGINWYELGDITSQSTALLSSSVSGSGISIKRGANNLQEQSSDVLLEGDAPPGWEVELYRNGALIDFAEASGNGQYSFANVSTYLGENIFDIRIYGPQGQYRTRQKRITVGSNMLARGKWDFQLQALERNQRLVDLSENTNDEESSAFLIAKLHAGINEYFTLQSAFSRFRPEGYSEDHNYASLGFFASVYGGLSELNYAVDQQSGKALLFSYKNRFHDVNFNFDTEKYDQFISDKNPDGALELDSKLRINGLWSEAWLNPVSYDLELQHSRYKASQQWQASTRLSTRLGLTQVSHLLNFHHSSLDDLEDTLNTSISATRRWHNWRFKAEASHQLLPSSSLESIFSSASYQASKRINYQASISYTHSGQKTYSFDNSVSWRFEKMSISLSAGFDTEKHQSIGINLSSALAYDKPRKSLYLSSDSITSNASLVAHTFLDHNNNQVFDDDDTPLPGIYFKGRNNWRQHATDPDGYVTLWNIPNLQMQSIDIDSRQIEDPYIKPLKTSYHVYSHAGKMSQLSIPFQTSLEIEGEIKLLKSGDSQPLAGVPISLYSHSGKLIQKRKTEYDGIFIFEEVLPGRYKLGVDQRYLERYSLLPIKEIDFTASGEEGLIYLPAITLQQTEAE